MVMTSAVTAIGTSLNLDSQTLFSLNQMNYSFEFKKASVQAINSNGATYTTLSMPGCLSIGKQTGDPAMPIKAVQLLLPPKKTVSSINIIGTPVTVKLSNIDLTKKPIFPQQQSVPIDSDQLPEFTINSNIYSSDIYYPTTRYSDYNIGYSHGYAILSLSLNPMQYNPVKGTLIYYPKMTVTITLKDENNVNQFFSNNPADEAYVKTLVSNPEVANLYSMAGRPTLEYPGGLCSPSQHYDYVIVTTTQNGLNHWNIGGTLTYNWDSLIAQHNSEGLSSTIVTIQDINACSDYQNSTPLFNDQPAHIREFCKDAYEDWGTRYVLIAGDSDTIAARQMYYTGEGGNVDSDLYWSNLDNSFNADQDSRWGESGDSGFDLYSEMYIGRITCDTPQDVSNWLTKSFYYANTADWDYLENAAFYGGALGFPGIGGDDFVDYSAIKGTNDYLGTNPHYAGAYPAWLGFQYGFETWNLVNEGNQFNLSVKWTGESSPNPGWHGGSETAAVNGLRTDINNDRVTIIAGLAHANNQMSLDVSASAWESQYTNTKPFFIHDYGCHCGDFDDGDDGIIESMLFKSNTKLAFGCVYNTGYGWGQYYCTNSSSAHQQKSFFDYFFDMENNSGDYGNWQFGKGQAWSKDNMAPMINWDTSSQTFRGTIQCCLLFGDPAQIFRSPHPSQAPLKPAKPSGPIQGVWNKEYSYTSSTTEPDNEQIFYLFNWDDGSNSGWLGPYTSGQTVTGSHTWTELGNYSVTVKARDIWGAGSPASDPLAVTITDNTPPNAPTITGESHIKPRVSYTYTLNGTDDQEQDLRYDIDWGDGNGGTGLGPYHSGEAFTMAHTWKTKGNYTIKTRTTDTAGAKSEWATLQVVAPTAYQFSLSVFLQHLFEKFPHMFPILRHLMGY